MKTKGLKTVITLFLVFVVMVCVFAECAIEEEIFVTSHTDPTGEYTVSLFQVGSPEWSFGPVKAKLVLKDKNGKKLDEAKFSLMNDGTGVYEGNIEKIVWKTDCVEVTMDESDTTKLYTYTLKYND